MPEGATATDLGPGADAQSAEPIQPLAAEAGAEFVERMEKNRGIQENPQEKPYLIQLPPQDEVDALLDPHAATLPPRPFRKMRIRKDDRGAAAAAPDEKNFHIGKYINDELYSHRNQMTKEELRNAPQNPIFEDAYYEQCQEIRILKRRRGPRRLADAENADENRVAALLGVPVLSRDVSLDRPATPTEGFAAAAAGTSDDDDFDDFGGFDENSANPPNRPNANLEEEERLAVEKWRRRLEAEKEINREQIAKRVAEWETRIEPILAEHARHRPFTVETYAYEILLALERNVEQWMLFRVRKSWIPERQGIR